MTDALLAFMRHFWLLGAIAVLGNYGLFRTSVIQNVESGMSPRAASAPRLFRAYHAVALVLCLLLYLVQSTATQPEKILLLEPPLSSLAAALTWLLVLGSNGLLLFGLWSSPHGPLLAQVALNGALPGESARNLLTVLAALLFVGLLTLLGVARSAA